MGLAALCAVVVAAAVTVEQGWQLERAERESIMQRQPVVLDALMREVKRLATMKEGGQLDLAAVTSFGWKELWVFRPYSWPDLVEKRLGFSWNGGIDSATVGNDRHRLLIFTDGSRVVMWLDFPLTDGEFDIGNETPVWRENAKLRVWNTPGGTVITKWGLQPSIHRFVHYNSEGKIEELTPEELKKREAQIMPKNVGALPK
jgi:hypothetical protein